MQTDRNEFMGGSGKAADPAGEGREAVAPEGGQRADERLVAYRERLEVEPGASREQTGEARLSIQVREMPERFEITRGHDEAVIRRTGVDGELVPGEHHEFTERSVRIPLFTEGSEVVVHKVSEPYAVADLGTRRVADTQTFETTLLSEEIVENLPPAASRDTETLNVREVQDGYELREREQRGMTESARRSRGEAAAKPEDVRDTDRDALGGSQDVGEGKGRGRWF